MARGAVAVAVALLAAVATSGAPPDRPAEAQRQARFRAQATLLQRRKGVFDGADSDLPDPNADAGIVDTSQGLVRATGVFKDEESTQAAASAASLRKEANSVAAFSPVRPSAGSPHGTNRRPPPRMPEPLDEAEPPTEDTQEVSQEADDAPVTAGEDLDAPATTDEAEAITWQDELQVGARPPLAQPATRTASPRTKAKAALSMVVPRKGPRVSRRPQAPHATRVRKGAGARAGASAPQVREASGAFRPQQSLASRVATVMSVPAPKKKKVNSDPPPSTSARTRPKGWDQCLRFTRNIKARGVTGTELVKVWQGTCTPAIDAGQATQRFQLMCNSLGGALEPFAAQIDYNVGDLCEAVLAVFHDVTAVDAKPVR